MPIIDMPVDMLLARIAREGKKSARLTVEDLVVLLPKLGCEVEEVARTQQYSCRRCGRIYDRTPAQGAPPACASCGADFRASPDQLGELGASQVIRLNMLAVRPDIFDPGGMARYIRGYLGIQTGLSEYALSAPRIRLVVDPRLDRDDSFRPYIACAVVRNARLDHGRIKMVMNLQEDLHWALGRNRKLASIGVYDLDTLAGDVFHYDAVDPDELRFVPLGLDPGNPANNLTPREILEKHKTGQAYAHLLKHLTRYPLLRDGRGTVLSLPPIINSESTRVRMDTQNFFVDVTGVSQRTVDRALNVIVTSFQEFMPDAQLECVVIESPSGRATPSPVPGSTEEGRPLPASEPGNGAVPTSTATVARITPDLATTGMLLDVQQASDTIGVALNTAQTAELLESMGHGIEESGHAGKLRVFVPAYRNDVIHAVDLIEDIAIAYGYDNLQPSLVPTFTLGRPRLVEEQAVVARRVLAGLGFHQVMTLTLTSEPAALGKWRLPPDSRAVLIENPISVEQTMCRVSLLPGLLETLAINKQYDLPQNLFEVGDVCFVDPDAETGAREERYAAAVMIGTHVGYADVRAVADAFVHEVGAVYVVRPTEHPSFIPGRVAALFDSRERRIGTMGELHPEVLENYGLKHAVAAIELSLEKLLGS